MASTNVNVHSLLCILSAFLLILCLYQVTAADYTPIDAEDNMVTESEIEINNDDTVATNQVHVEAQNHDIEKEILDYAKGSACGYCKYCKFCTMCDKSCPCKSNKKNPNCHMCKYCKYCYLCSAVCDTICQPGGILDRVSSKIISALPSFDKEEVSKDIDGVKWGEHKKDEL